MTQTNKEMPLRVSGIVCEVCGCEEGCLQRWEDEGGGPQYLAGIERRSPRVLAESAKERARLQTQTRSGPAGLACPICGCEDGCLHRWEDDGGPILVSAAPGGFSVELTHVTT